MPFSFVQYPGNGSTVSFAVPFPYLLSSHVRLYYGLNFISGGYTQLLVDGTDYNWNTGGTQITLTSPPGSGALLTIRRETPTANRLVDFADGSNLIEQNLDTAGLQTYYVVQELYDYIEQLSISPGGNVPDGAVTEPKLTAAVLEQLTPAGVVQFFPATVAPAGWLKANGAAISRTTYPKLWAYAQASGNLAASEGAKQAGQFGPGNGSTTFTIPDLRGEFVRGWDDSRGVDSERAIGSAQGDAIRNITGRVLDYIYNESWTEPGGATGAFYDVGSNWLANSSGPNTPYGGYPDQIYFDASRQVPTASENRPRNVALLACIKF